MSDLLGLLDRTESTAHSIQEENPLVVDRGD
jgi:hypothetical protein